MKRRLTLLLVPLFLLVLIGCGQIPTPFPPGWPAQQATVPPTPTPAPTSTPTAAPAPAPTETPASTPTLTLTPGPRPSGEVLAFLGKDVGEMRLYKAWIDDQGLHNLVASQEVVGGIPFGMYPTGDGRYVAVDVGVDTDSAVNVIDMVLNDFFLPIANGRYLGNGWFMNWTPNGDMLYVALGGYGLLPTGLWRIDVRQDEGHRHFDIDVPVPAAIASVAISPDGSTILYSISKGLGHGGEVWRMNADGSGQTLLWSDPYHDIVGLEYSPDGSRVAYVLLPDSPVPFPSASLCVMDADGSNQRLFYEQADGGHGYRPRWSPNGTKIAFVGKENPATYEGRELPEGAINNIYLADPATGQVWTLLPLEPGQQHNYDPWWSPDGSQIVFVSDRSGADEIWAINADGTNLRQLTSDGRPKRYPLWIQGWTSSFLPLLFQGPQGEKASPPAHC